MDIKISNAQPNFRARLYVQNIKFKPEHYKNLIKYANTIGSASDEIFIKKNIIRTIVNGNSRKSFLNILDINEDSRVQKIKETVNGLLKPATILTTTAAVSEIANKKEVTLNNIVEQNNVSHPLTTNTAKTDVEDKEETLADNIEKLTATTPTIEHEGSMTFKEFAFYHGNIFSQMIKCLKSKIENLEFTSENHLSEPDTNPISYKFKNWISKSDNEIRFVEDFQGFKFAGVIQKKDNKIISMRIKRIIKNDEGWLVPTSTLKKYTFSKDIFLDGEYDTGPFRIINAKNLEELEQTWKNFIKEGSKAKPSNLKQQEDIPTNTTIQTPQAVPKTCVLPKKYKYTFNTLLEYLKEKYSDMEFTTNPNKMINNVEGDFNSYEMSRDCPYDSSGSLERFLAKVDGGKYVLNTWEKPAGFYLRNGYPRTVSYVDYVSDYAYRAVRHYTDSGLVLPGRRIDKYKLLFEGKNRVKEGFFDKDKYIFDEYNWSVTCIEERKNCTIKKMIKRTGEYPHYYFPNELISKEIETKNSRSIFEYYDDFMLSSKIFKDKDKVVAFSISNFKDFKVISHEKARDFMIIKYPDSEDIIIKSENDNQEYRVSARNLKELKENVYFS